MKKIALITALLLTSTVSMADDSYMGEILGGVAGGVIGNQIGGGKGKIVTTAIGAVIGSQVGGRVEDNMNNNRPQRTYSQQQYSQPRQVIVVPANVPTPLGYRCELQSVYVNGQVVVNNYCY